MRTVSCTSKVLTLILVAFAFSSLSAVQAQNQKFGFIDTDFILSQIPEYEGIEQRLRQLTETWRREITELDEEIESLQRDFEAREILFTPEIRQEREQEIQNKKRERERLVNQRFGPEGDYLRQQRELLSPIQRQIVEATGRIAERDGFDFIIDRSGEYLLFYTNPQWDLSIDVLLELGIQVDEDVRP
ncbi:periplasmic chaperone for outer membrane proteins Skp [Cyclonatronum proteinivorum]|uniref:Periplasmic chaperone for outer membrane proteins Skp n=1 Tax=Cyclonatronum proteinivorum TaxID=1457365 RepID=A0A345UMS6_9BACT|nr:OmpH family outer membrane protein [Cyclonatronum proteinivorum]AXJ01778.1 periplasmic chaperone for outer membrane proteins Skp [Cyclonatronum proteinivorum]